MAGNNKFLTFVKNILTGKKKFRTVAQQAFQEACLSVCGDNTINFRELNIAQLDTQLNDHIVMLLRGTLNNLVVYFEQEGVKRKEEDVISKLKEQLQDDNVLLVNVINNLRKNLEAIPAGFFNRGLVYRTFKVTLTLPKFKQSTILRHFQKTEKTLKEENASLKERVGSLEEELGKEVREREEMEGETAYDAMHTRQRRPAFSESNNAQVETRAEGLVASPAHITTTTQEAEAATSRDAAGSAPRNAENSAGFWRSPGNVDPAQPEVLGDGDSVARQQF